MSLSMFDRFDGHEQVVFGHDDDTGLRCIIAIHSTALGPALGGTRFHPYPDDDAALTDVLRLSRAMSYKAACAGSTSAAARPSSSATPPPTSPSPCCVPTAA